MNVCLRLNTRLHQKIFHLMPRLKPGAVHGGFDQEREKCPQKKARGMRAGNDLRPLKKIKGSLPQEILAYASAE